MPQLNTSLPNRRYITVDKSDSSFNNNPYKLSKVKGLSLRLKATLLAVAIGTLPLLTVGTGGYLVF